MKKLLLGALAALTVFPGLADLTGSGFYRVQNAKTKRYAYLLDNKGSFDVATSSADVNALQLYSGFLRASSDPSTVFYVEDEGSNFYNIAGQGTDLYSFFGSFMKVLKTKQYDGRQAYLVYATKSGMTKYLGDLRSDLSDERGYPSVDAGGDYRLWYVDGINAAGDNYFGIAPSLSAGGKYYHTIYAGFQFAPYSAGVKTYVVNRVEPSYGVVVIKEVSGKVYAGTPLIVECANPLAADNRLTVGPDGDYVQIPTNYLRGVFFDNDNATHYNRTPYDKNSMRSLAVVDGKLMFVKGNYEFCPRNEAYLQLPDAASCAIDNWQVMTEAEFDAYVASLNSQNPDGYYRMQNVVTKRYAHITDNRGSASDAGALQTYSDLLRASSDPASVMYMQRPADGSVLTRDLFGQGTGTRAIFGAPLSVTAAATKDGLQTYTVATSAGNLGDAQTDADQGQMTVGASGEAAQWWFKTIAGDTDNHFGVAPSVTAGGKYYHPFMADFPVAAASEGVSFYVVSKVDSELEVMVLRKAEGVIPAGTPVIVECANPLAADNRLTVGATGDAADVSGNLLSGVYYNTSGNRTAYDRNGMRSLTAVDGKLTFAAANADFVPRNEAYIALANDGQKSVASYQVVTADEYAAMTAGLKNLVEEGYYRLRNADTDRTLFMLDNKGSIRTADNSDLGAFRLYSDVLQAASDPASVFRATKVSDADIPEWNLFAQNSSFSGALSSTVKFLPADDETLHAYTLKNGGKVYFADNGAGEDEAAFTTATGATNRRWTLDAIDAASDDNYFGVAPSVTAGGKYYHPFMANFPFTPYSDGMKVYIVTKVDANNKAIVMKEVTGTIPASNAVIIECAGPLASDNRLAIGDGEAAEMKGNQLKGVWYDSDFAGHVNHTAFEKDSMRVLGDVDGQISFVKADYDAVPRNMAYMRLGGSKQLSVANYSLYTEEQYKDKVGVAEIAADAIVEVYRIDGTRVADSMLRGDVETLPHGIYLLRSGDTCEKVIVR